MSGMGRLCQSPRAGNVRWFRSRTHILNCCLVGIQRGPRFEDDGRGHLGDMWQQSYALFEDVSSI